MTQDPQRRLTIGLAAALVVTLVAVGWLWLDRGDAPETGASTSSSASAEADLLAAGADATTAARAAVERMTTYDWRTVDNDFTWVDEAGTEKFQTYFAGASSDAKKVISTLKATASGTVVDAAPSVTDATHVKVLLFVDQEITAAEQKGTKLDQPRVSMEMVLVDGSWLVDAVAVNDLLG